MQIRVGAPNSLLAAPGGALLAFAPEPADRVMIWDWSARKAKAVIQQPRANWCFLMAFSHDARLLAIASDQGAPRVWLTETGQPFSPPMGGHLAAVWKMTFSADNKSLVTYCEDRTAKIWNVAAGREVLSGLPLNDFLLKHPHWSLLAADGNTIVESAGENSIRLVRLPTLAEIDAEIAAMPGKP